MAKRVLVIINTLNVGGAETFIMKAFRSLNRSIIILDFLVCEKEKGVYESEVESLGGHVYHGYYKVQNPIRNLYYIYKTVRKGNYKTVLIFSQHPIVFFDLLASMLGGAKHRIVRSTNSACGGFISRMIALFFRPLMNCLISDRIAPSREAAMWLFGKNIVKKGKYLILNNGLDLNAFNFNETDRQRFRAEMGIKDEVLIGHVGRFNYQKNHMFLIEIFEAYHKMNPNSKLILIGKGETKDDVIEKVKRLELVDSVLFLDVRSDIPYCLCGFDAFAFPSLYEGMPNTVVEAQACGLPCLISNTITPQAGITDLVKFKSLNDTPLSWAKELQMMTAKKPDRQSYSLAMKEKGYSIDDVCKKLVLILS